MVLEKTNVSHRSIKGTMPFNVYNLVIIFNILLRNMLVIESIEPLPFYYLSIFWVSLGISLIEPIIIFQLCGAYAMGSVGSSRWVSHKFNIRET